ncbi:alcohol dehydrogenase catalytic domain-containing protein [Amycolatopsis panacis]|uniref:alcohol dehydrogenase catalytic domain-containing protein n=1 Tax=Amycolatopsis panacis TaxID=2340917 RepID=UPI001F2AA7BF|nr:alcohol dehydrogenase catalytic domain-containing protein [Amycolatopsis panacis]
MRFAAFDRYGPTDVLYETTGPPPQEGPEEVLVRMRAVSVNSAELALRSGAMRPLSGRRFPKRLGTDLVGEIVDPGTSRFATGDHVWGMFGRRMGSAAEYVAVDADHVPDGWIRCKRHR